MKFHPNAIIISALEIFAGRTQEAIVILSLGEINKPDFQLLDKSEWILSYRYLQKLNFWLLTSIYVLSLEFLEFLHETINFNECHNHLGISLTENLKKRHVSLAFGE